jgi:hypothetical protein
VLIVFAGLALCGCGKPPDAETAAASAKPAQPAILYSYAQASDLRVTPQLGAGWYQIEDGAWRWVAREAVVMLRPPASLPAPFEVRFTLAKGHVALTGPVTLTVLINDQPLVEQTYAKDGSYTLERMVMAGAIASSPVKVALRFDKARPPAPPDVRELAAIMVGVGFK